MERDQALEAKSETGLIVDRGAGTDPFDGPTA
jgi:hypothetical protein